MVLLALLSWTTLNAQLIVNTNNGANASALPGSYGVPIFAVSIANADTVSVTITNIVLSIGGANPGVFSNITAYDGSFSPIGVPVTWGTLNNYFAISKTLAPGTSAVIYFKADIGATCLSDCYSIGIEHVDAVNSLTGNWETIMNTPAYGPNLCIIHSATATFTGIPDTVCENVSFIPNISYTWNGVPSCVASLRQVWRFDYGSSIQTQLWNGSNPPSMRYYTAGTHYIWVDLIDTATNNLIQTFQVSINVASEPQLSFYSPSNTTLDCLHDSLLLIADGNGTAEIFWKWNSTFLSTGDTIVVTQPGIYSIIATTTYGCTNTWTANFNVYRDVFSMEMFASGNGSSHDTLFICPDASAGVGVNVTNNWAYPVTYTWNTGETSSWINQATAGTYIVTATNTLGCTLVDSVHILNHTIVQPTLTALGDTVFCAGSNPHLTILTAPGFELYQWNGVVFNPNNTSSDSAKVEWGGTVSLTVRDSFGCWTSAANEITVHQHFPEQSLVTELGCQLFSSVTTGITWKLNGNALNDTNAIIQPTVTGIYSVTTVDTFGCVANSNSLPFVAPNLPLISTNGSTQFCAGGSVLLSIQDGSSFTWSTGATTQSILVTTSGTYTATVTNNGCVQETSPIEVTAECTTGIDETEGEELFSMFPNPTTGVLNVISAAPLETIVVTDVTGKEIIKIQPTDSEEVLNTSGLPAGLYVLTVVSEGKHFSQRFVKQ